MPYIVCIDGNIGAGKSSLLNELESKGCTVFREQNDGSYINDWLWALDNCYSDPKRWAFTLQISIIMSMAEQKRSIDKINQPIVFIERCPLSTIVFTNIWRNQGCLTDREFNLINELNSMLEWKPDLTLMLTTPPHECFQRVVKRGRECETGISLDYITRVANEYDRVYSDKKFIPLDYIGDVADKTVNLISKHQNLFTNL